MTHTHTKANTFSRNVIENWAAMGEMSLSGICGQRKPRSDCACAQSELGNRCPLTESSETESLATVGNLEVCRNAIFRLDGFS